MMKRRLCEASFTWRLTCEGPLLIADGRYRQDHLGQPGKDKGKYPDKIFISRDPLEQVNNAIRTSEPEALRLSFYAPGTSLRGPLRAQAERIVRSVLPPDAKVPVTACDPFEDEKDSEWRSCSLRLVQTKVAVPYKALCPACKLFGSTASASRLRIQDAMIEGMEGGNSFHSAYRDMIGIDRFTGGVRSGPMRFHVLERTALETTVTVLNFELWHVGLLAHVFRDFHDGLVAIGFGKTKGFGQVRGEVTAITLTYPRDKGDGRLHHLASLCEEQEIERYGLYDRGEEPQTLDLGTRKPVGYGLYESFDVKDGEPLWAAGAAAFEGYMESLRANVA